MGSAPQSAVINKYLKLTTDLPKGFEVLATVDCGRIEREVAALSKKERLMIAHFASLMGQIEMLKHSVDYGDLDMRPLMEGLFFQDMIPLVVFFEFWKDLNIGRSTELAKISALLQGQRFHRIRNAVAHADVEIGLIITFNDRAQSVQMPAVQASKLASCLSMLAVVLGLGNATTAP